MAAHEVVLKISDGGLEGGNVDVAEALDGLVLYDTPGLAQLLGAALAVCLEDMEADLRDFNFNASVESAAELANQAERTARIAEALKRLQGDLDSPKRRRPPLAVAGRAG